MGEEEAMTNPHPAEAVARSRSTVLAGQKALVTGANSGIGKATAIALGAPVPMWS